jgi:hypothetical protein
MTGSISLTFSLYESQEGGNPLWVETQKAEVDKQGHYTVLLGATQPSGLRLDLFTTGQRRWLGVGEQAKVLLVGMPYALKVADADPLDGKPPSAFVAAYDSNASSAASNSTRVRPVADSGKAEATGKPRADAMGSNQTT